jgi:outer membrane protein
MKKIALFAKFLLAAVVVSFTSCSSDNKEDQKEATAVQGEQKGEAYETQSMIRYVDMDTIYAHYDYAIEIDEQVRKIQLEFQQYQSQLERKFQTRQNEIQKKHDSNGYLTEASLNADLQELQNMGQNSQKDLSAREQRDSAKAAALTKALNDSINNFIVEYNKAHHYDAILYKQTGLYFNPSLDITAEVTKGLNERYKKPAAAAATDAKK